MKRLIMTMVVLWVALGMAVVAQVKGHTYYNWDGSLDGDIKIQLLMEVDNVSEQALGEIIYTRKNGKTSPIRLYGYKIENTDGDEAVHYAMFEYLPNGTISGTIRIVLDKGRFKYGIWATVDHSRRYSVIVNETKPFPYAERPTFFKPFDPERGAKGVYRFAWKRIENPESTAQLMLVVNDGSQRYDWSSQKGQGGLDVALLFDNHCMASQHVETTEGNVLRFVTPEDASIQVTLFDGFAYLTKVYDPQGNSGLINPDGYYILQPNDKILPMPGFDYGMWARLTDGQVKLSFDREVIQEKLAGFIEDMSMCGDGTDLQTFNQAGEAADIYVNDIGQDTHPILAVLLNDGRVQIYSPFEGVDRGTQTLSRPLWNQKNIRWFSTERNPPLGEDEEMDYVTFYGVDWEGKTFEIFNNVLMWGEWEYETGEGDQRTAEWIELTEEWAIYHNHVKGGHNLPGTYVHNYYGYCWMEENQPDVYHYHYTQENDNRNLQENKDCSVDGTFRVEGYDSDEDGTLVVIITPLTGDKFGAKKLGEKVRMRRTRSVG